MRILLLHNRYQQAGGEDAVVLSEKNLLASRGHTVALLEADNDGIAGTAAQVRAALRVTYSGASRRRVAQALRDFRPDVAHVHNFFPVFSPSIFYACAEHRVPVIQTLHNYRLLCPGALLFHDGQICESCITKTLKYPGVLKGCYRGSRAGTLAVAAMVAAHFWMGTWTKLVNRYIALTAFSRDKFIAGGLPAERISIKPNFLEHDPAPGDGGGGYALFVGRLSEEKGIDVLLRAWEKVRTLPLKIIGAGPLVERVLRATVADPSIEYLGPKPADDVYSYMGRAKALIFPSVWYEGFPRTIIESFAKGTPVIASRLGSMEEIIAHGGTGLHFAPGRPEALVEQVEWMLTHAAEWQKMRHVARREFESKYMAERNHSMLMEIYQQVMARGVAAAAL